MISGKKYWSDGTPVAGQQFEYAFDDIGNRTSTKEGGDGKGRNLRPSTYSANTLNQYTSRDVPGYVNVLGSATNTATVSLWAGSGNFAQTERHSDYFRGELVINNSTGAVWLTITNVGVLRNGTNADIVTNIIGSTFVAQTPESFAFDLDGNQTRDGRWTNTWDGENRLLSMVSLTNTPAASKLRLTFGYDTQWRRIFKTVETWNGSAWTVTLSNKFVYDGWNLIAELNGTNNGAIRTYMWGTDLSGTMQGAGGVGGLLTVNDVTQGSHFVCFNGNGNVMGMLGCAAAVISVRYEYAPFGKLMRSEGPIAKEITLRFSTKYVDEESGLSYYGFRYYELSRARWVNRDPIDENGGINLMAFVLNRPLTSIDLVGQTIPSISPYAYPPYHPVEPPPPSYPPPNPINPDRLKKNDCSCCGAEEVSDGLRELTRRFLISAQWFENHNVRHDPQAAQYSGGASCYNGNSSILAVMNRTPRCWVCFMDRRYNGQFFGGDESFIHCFSLGQIHQEAVFDWFEGGPDQNQIFQGGVYVGGSLGNYFNEHPYQAPFPTENPNLSQWVDCSQKDPPWTFNTGPLQQWIPNTPAFQ